jgi:AraC-like DNA-binding protein
MALTLVSRDCILEDPIGRAAAGDHHMMWCVDAALAGVTLWGRPTAADLEDLFALLSLPHHPWLQQPCAMVVDGALVEGVDPPTFQALVDLALRHRAAIRGRTHRQAVVHPAGLPGALFAGFNSLLDPDYEWRAFMSLGEALMWLGRPDADALGDEVTRMVAAAVQTSPLVARLGTWLAGSFGRPSIAEAATALGVSVRSLQRHLAAHGMSFREIGEDVTMARAEALLLDTDLKIESIAHQVGCSGEYLIKSFRRRKGLTPGEWRKQRR